MTPAAGTPTVSPRLLRAYRATRYSAAEVELRVGRRSAAMDALLARLGGRTGVFVTAWNPLSRRRPAGWNRRMQSRLAQRLRRWRHLPADGSLHRWHEAHWLVVADLRPVLRLARLFRQRAVVIATLRQPARLHVLGGRAARPDGFNTA